MRPSINRILESPFVQESLKSFSAELEEQAQKDKSEFDGKKSSEPAKPAAAAQPVAQAPAAGCTKPLERTMAMP